MIRNNDKAANIVTKGANFRPINNKEITQGTNEFRDAISSFSLRMAKKYQISPRELHSWESKFIQIHKQIYPAKSSVNNCKIIGSLRTTLHIRLVQGTRL